MLTCAALLLCLAAPAPLADPASTIDGLGRRVELAEDRLARDLEDLARLDTCAATAACHGELRRIERWARDLEGADLTAEQRRRLRVDVFEQLDYARYRLHQVEVCAIGAARLSALLARMRAARASGRPELAVALHVAGVGTERPERSSPVLLRRLDRALRAERGEADAELASRPVAAPR